MHQAYCMSVHTYIDQLHLCAAVSLDRHGNACTDDFEAIEDMETGSDEDADEAEVWRELSHVIDS